MGIALSSCGKFSSLSITCQSLTMNECKQPLQLFGEVEHLRVVILDSGSNVLYGAPHLRKIARVWLSLERFCRVDIDFPALEGRVRSCDGEDQALDLDFSCLNQETARNLKETSISAGSNYAWGAAAACCVRRSLSRSSPCRCFTNSSSEMSSRTRMTVRLSSCFVTPPGQPPLSCVPGHRARSPPLSPLRGEPRSSGGSPRGS